MNRSILMIAALYLGLHATVRAQERSGDGDRPVKVTFHNRANQAPGAVRSGLRVTGSAVTAKEAEDLVRFHNTVRRDVGVGPVEWSAELAQFAQEWANRLAQMGDLAHRPRTGRWAQRYGENLAIDASVLKGAQAWHSEIKDYSRGTPIPAPDDFADFESGHYTQMVWRKTTRIGAGKAVVQRGSYKGQLVIVCNYSPGGNVSGERPY